MLKCLNSRYNFTVDLYIHLLYNVTQGADAVKDKLLHIRVDEVFLSKVEYIKNINGFKSIAETIRKIIEKEYRKEKK